MGSAFSIEIAVFISVDVVESVVFGEGRQFGNDWLIAVPVFEFLDRAIFDKVSGSSPVTVSTAVSWASGFGVMGAVTGVALPDVDRGKRRSYWDIVGAGGGGGFSW